MAPVDGAGSKLTQSKPSTWSVQQLVQISAFKGQRPRRSSSQQVKKCSYFIYIQMMYLDGLINILSAKFLHLKQRCIIYFTYFYFSIYFLRSMETKSLLTVSSMSSDFWGDVLDPPILSGRTMLDEIAFAIIVANRFPSIQQLLQLQSPLSLLHLHMVNFLKITLDLKYLIQLNMRGNVHCAECVVLYFALTQRQHKTLIKT